MVLVTERITSYWAIVGCPFWRSSKGAGGELEARGSVLRTSAVTPRYGKQRPSGTPRSMQAKDTPG